MISIFALGIPQPDDRTPQDFKQYDFNIKNPLILPKGGRQDEFWRVLEGVAGDLV